MLIRALEPLDGIELMRGRRGPVRDEDLCTGPGKLTQALGIGLDLNGTSSPAAARSRSSPARRPEIVAGEPRIGITKAVDLPWRFCDAAAARLAAVAAGDEARRRAEP